MASNKNVSYEEIVAEAIRIVRKNGIEAVNDRNIAKNLNCSVQQINKTFTTKDKLKSAVVRRTFEIYKEVMEKALEKDNFIEMGLDYLYFIKNEKNLFKLLFMSNLHKNKNLLNITGANPNNNKVRTIISNTTGLKKSKADEMFSGMWFVLHGIGSLLATNDCDFNDDEVRQLLSNAYYGLIYSLRTDEHTKLIEQLSKRKQEIIKALLAGNDSYKKLSAALNISVNTVKTHLKQIYQATGIPNINALISHIKKYAEK